MKTFAIGDVHGNYAQLTDLVYDLRANGFSSKFDRLVFLGDLVDGGPDTNKVLEWAISNKKSFPHWVFLKGNHEDLLLDAVTGRQNKYKSFDLWWSQGGRATTESYVRDRSDLSDYEKSLLKNPRDVITPEHLDFLRTLPIYFEDENGFYVHAGVPHGIKLENFKKRIDDGDEDYIYQALWIRDEFINSKTDWGKKIIYGHTATKEPNIQPNKIGIDTMIRIGGKLTAVELPAEKFYFTEHVGQWW